MIEKLFERLMTTPVKCISRTKSVGIDGSPVYADAIEWEDKCNFHTTSQNNLQFADRIGDKTAFLVCVSKNLKVKENWLFEINSERYIVVGVRKASRKFEHICEVVKYE